MYSKSLLRHLVMFYVGFVTYITVEVLYRGYSYPLMGLLGGISLILIGMINNKISWHLDLAFQGLIGTVNGTTLEYITGVADRAFLHLNMWDYSDVPLNFQGIICLPFSIAWFALSIIAIFIADAIDYYIFDEQPLPHYHVGRWIFYFREKDKHDDKRLSEAR